MKRKIFKTALLCFGAILIAISITGCANSADNTSDTQQNTTQNSTQNNTQTTETTVSNTTQETTEETEMNTITITVNGTGFTAELYDNEAAKAFAAMLPMTVDASELHGNEKYYYMNETLPTNSSRPDMIHTGDLMLYGSDCLVLFYKDFSTSYSYTPLGRITDPAGLEKAVGSSGAEITFEVSE